MPESGPEMAACGSFFWIFCSALAVVDLADVEVGEAVDLVVFEGDLQVVGSECPDGESASKMLTSMKSPRV